MNSAFVINLDNRTDRWEKIQESFKDTNIKLIRWSAVNGKNLTDDEISRVSTFFCNNFCSNGMIGCYLSHYKLWNYIVENNLDNVLIFEDDAKPTEKFNKNIFNQIPADYDIVYLGCFGSCDKIGDTIIGFFSGKYNKPYNDILHIPVAPLGTHAYILSNKGARKLITNEKLAKVRYHVDYTLVDHIYIIDPDFKMYAFKEPFVMQSSNINTSDLLSNEHPLINVPMSYIKLSDNYNLDYIMNVQTAHIRKLNATITGYFIFFSFLSLFIGLCCSTQIIKVFLGIITILFITESCINKWKNVNNMIIEYIAILIFLYLGYKINMIN